ncbi:GNAT family N-acetyltransferase [soil metagenome]
MTAPPRISPVDPHDDDALRAWYAAIDAGARADRDCPLVSTYAAFTFTMRSPGRRRRRLPFAAYDGAGGVVGAMLVELPLTSDLDTFEVEVDVPPAHRRRGVGRALWAHAKALAAEHGRTVAQTEVHVPAAHTPATWPGSLFAEGIGFSTQHVEDHLVLDLPAPGADAEVAPGYRLRGWAGPCPDEDVEAYAALQSAMNADVPTGGMTRDVVEITPETVRTSEARLAESYLTVVALAETADGQPVGYTLVFAPHEDPANLLQDDTLVLRAHRGNGLGRVLKEANQRRLDRHCPDARRVHTWVAETNTAMQATNARLGFRAVEKLHEMERGL